MEFKFLSDTHNDHGELTNLECDVLVHCGDANTKGNYSEGLEFLWWFVKQPAKYKILVPGNHDFKLQTHPELITLARDLGIIVLNDDFVNLNGLSIYGVSKTFKSISNKNDTSTAQERRAAWKNIPKDLDLLITHTPPYEILDGNKENVPCGCPALREAVLRKAPRFHAFGHIHEHGGKSRRIDNTRFGNTSVKNELYLTVRGAKLVSIFKEG